MKNRRAGAALVAGLVITMLVARDAFAQPKEPTPAQAADPPPIPPTISPRAPISVSGADVLPPSPLLPTAPPVVATPADDVLTRRRAVDTRLALAELRIRALEDDLGPLRHLKVQGYVQLQYRFESFNAAASPNQIGGSLPSGIASNDVIAKSDGTTTNSNLFRLRRTRLRTIYETDIVRVFLEAELLPAGGPTATDHTLARNAEVTGIAHWTRDLKTEFTGGLFQVPFFAETLESSMTRPFIERTFMAESFFPSERDVGLHARTVYGRRLVTLDIGVLNGHRLGEANFTVQPDLDSSKDVFAMATVEKGPLDVSLSGYLGRNQLVDAVQLRVKNFRRMAANLAAHVTKTFSPRLGDTKLGAELMFGQNMDTGALTPFALPTVGANFGSDVNDVNERGLSLRVDQDLTEWGIAGFRYDTYTPDSSIANDGRNAYVWMVGARFSKYLRLIHEISYAVDNLHVAALPAPARHTLGSTMWLQGSFF